MASEPPKIEVPYATVSLDPDQVLSASSTLTTGTTTLRSLPNSPYDARVEQVLGGTWTVVEVHLHTEAPRGIISCGCAEPLQAKMIVDVALLDAGRRVGDWITHPSKVYKTKQSSAVFTFTIPGGTVTPSDTMCLLLKAEKGLTIDITISKVNITCVKTVQVIKKRVDSWA